MKSPGHNDLCRCGACTHHEGVRLLLSLCEVSFVRDSRLILDDVNFTVDRGDFLAITGPNGGGKTTLLRLILGLLTPGKGKIVYYDEHGKEMPRDAFRPGYLPQKNSVDSHFPITVGEVIASGLLSVNNLDKAEKQSRVAEALKLVELSDLASRPIGRLSGGQLQRALLGRAIVARPHVLILDEPLSYLDRHFEEQLYRILSQIADKSTVLLVSHQISKIDALANRHVIVDHALTECTHQHHYKPIACAD